MGIETGWLQSNQPTGKSSEELLNVFVSAITMEDLNPRQNHIEGKKDIKISLLLYCLKMFMCSAQE